MFRSIILIILLAPAGCISGPDQRPPAVRPAATVVHPSAPYSTPRQGIIERSLAKIAKAEAGVANHECQGPLRKDYYDCLSNAVVSGFQEAGWRDMGSVYRFSTTLQVIGERIDRGELTEAEGSLASQEAYKQIVIIPEADRVDSSLRQLAAPQEAERRSR